MSRFNLIRSALVLTAVVSAWLSPALAGPHEHEEGDVRVGRLPNGQLKLLFTGGMTVLPVINSGPLTGWGLDEPGFFSIDETIPDEDMSPLAPGNNIMIEVVGAGLDNGLKSWLPGFGNYLGNGPLSVLSWNLGPDFTDTHSFWHIDPTTDGFVAPPGQTEWSATIRVIDTGSTGYLPSNPITLTFAPEPTSLGLLALGGMLTLRRKRRRHT